MVPDVLNLAVQKLSNLPRFQNADKPVNEPVVTVTLESVCETETGDEGSVGVPGAK